MTKREFVNAVARGRGDEIQRLLDALTRLRIDYCVVGGLAVNAYCDPVVSLDLDIVVTATEVDRLCEALKDAFSAETHPHSVNLTSSTSDLRIQLQTDRRYQEFIGRGHVCEVLGYSMKVAALADVLQGKVWAYSDGQRRRSKRQKDLADILRLVETHQELKDSLPPELRKDIE